MEESQWLNIFFNICQNGVACYFIEF
jgi:hypothetical protein